MNSFYGYSIVKLTRNLHLIFFSYDWLVKLLMYNSTKCFSEFLFDCVTNNLAYWWKTSLKKKILDLIPGSMNFEIIFQDNF